MSLMPRKAGVRAGRRHASVGSLAAPPRRERPDALRSPQDRRTRRLEVCGGPGQGCAAHGSSAADGAYASEMTSELAGRIAQPPGGPRGCLVALRVAQALAQLLDGRPLERQTPAGAGVRTKPSIGLEPMTPSLPWKCSTN